MVLWSEGNKRIFGMSTVVPGTGNPLWNLGFFHGCQPNPVPDGPGGFGREPLPLPGKPKGMQDAETTGTAHGKESLSQIVGRKAL
jgi:hypothetical protein